MVTENVKIKFINRSYDTNNSSIVIYQKNTAETFDSIAIAWRVIENCGRDDYHPFVVPLQFDVSAKDSWGNYTPETQAYNGTAYEMVRDNTGDVLRLASTGAKSPNEVEVRNNLPMGSIDACIFKDGKLLAKKTQVSPGQKADFQFHPRLYCGVVSQIVEGEEMSSAIIQQANTEINLFGVLNADLVLTGGGGGPRAEPFEFQLENINAS